MEPARRSPHTEDEIHVVTAGRAKIVTPDATADVGPAYGSRAR
ncbi:hypothetical protein ACQPZ8_43375 [Actinomadura nitritigenes]